MFKFLLYLVVFNSSVVVYGQHENIVYILENETYQLNGGVRAAMGGSSRNVIPINIPRNAKGLVYTIQAYRKGESFAKSLNLGLALATYTNTGSISLATAVSKIEIPSGTTTVDAFLIGDRNSRQLFLNKSDGYWKSYELANRTSCVECKAALSFQPYSMPEIVYLALRNPSALDAITVVVNVAAIIN